MPATPLPPSVGPATGWLRRRLRSRRVVVADRSMIPALLPGDRLLVDPRAYRARDVAVGDVVVLVDPDDPARWLVKRVAAVDPATGRVEVRGDASEVARDSRQFGPVPRDALVGRAYRLYFPLDRARDL